MSTTAIKGLEIDEKKDDPSHEFSESEYKFLTDLSSLDLGKEFVNDILIKYFGLKNMVLLTIFAEETDIDRLMNCLGYQLYYKYASSCRMFYVFCIFIQGLYTSIPEDRSSIMKRIRNIYRIKQVSFFLYEKSAIETHFLNYNKGIEMSYIDETTHAYLRSKTIGTSEIQVCNRKAIKPTTKEPLPSPKSQEQVHFKHELFDLIGDNFEIFQDTFLSQELQVDSGREGGIKTRIVNKETKNLQLRIIRNRNL